MEIFKRIMEIISGISFIEDLKRDDEMRVASFITPKDNVRNSLFLKPLIEAGLISKEIHVDDFDQQRKVPLEIIENGKKFWRALLILRNEDTVTLAVSGSRVQP